MLRIYKQAMQLSYVTRCKYELFAICNTLNSKQEAQAVADGMHDAAHLNISWLACQSQYQI